MRADWKGSKFTGDFFESFLRIEISKSVDSRGSISKLNEWFTMSAEREKDGV